MMLPSVRTDRWIVVLIPRMICAIEDERTSWDTQIYRDGRF